MSKTEKLASDLYSLVKAEEIVVKTTDSLSRKFAKAANNVDGYGKKWTMFSRILSGSPLWKLQNYVRAVGQAMDGFMTTTENITKAANEQALAMGELTNNIDAVKEQLDLMEGAGDHAKLIESNLEYKNTFKALMAAGEEEAEARKLALTRTKNMYDATHKKLKDNLKSEGDALKKALALEKKLENEKWLMKSGFSEKDLKRYEKAMKQKEQAEMESYNLQKEIGGLRYSLEREQRRLRAKGIDPDDDMGHWLEKQRLKKLKRKQELVGKIGDSATKKLDSMRERGLDEETMGKIGEIVGQKREEWEAQKAKMMKVLEISGKVTERFMTFGLGFENIAKGLKDMKEGFPALRGYLKKEGGLTNAFRKKVRPITAMIGKVMKMALLYSMYFILFLVGALVAFVVLKKIFEKAEIMDTLLETLRQAFDGLKDMFSGAVLIFEAFFGGGTLGERLATLFKGILGLYKGLYKILWSVLKGILKLAVKLVVAYISFVIETYVKIFQTLWDWKTWLPKLWEKIVAFKDYLAGDFLSMVLEKLSEFGNNLVTFFGNELAKITDVLPFHMGGVTKGGMSLVGERGPELVKLPAGSRVYSNDTTKSMLGGSVTNNISVSVNGRLGASDSELRDIAKKIGRMVSTEINRTTSSSTNMRF